MWLRSENSSTTKRQSRFKMQFVTHKVFILFVKDENRVILHYVDNY